ncbi:MAG TPA: hypothetical protein DCX54_10340 [Flavobacteriales bacterium]|nr:hypothetical protein [Flavobacteriales bacterium]
MENELIIGTGYPNNFSLFRKFLNLQKPKRSKYRLKIAISTLLFKIFEQYFRGITFLFASLSSSLLNGVIIK